MDSNFGIVHLLCGKVCSGKSTYAKKLHQENNGIILSCDDLVLSIFDEHLGSKHDEVVAKCKEYLYNLAIHIAQSGCNVILDMGFWSKNERDTIKTRFNSLNIQTELHYIHVDDKTQLSQIDKRNSQPNGNCYYIDKAILEKCNSIFEPPTFEELSK